ncbi:MAG TPA: NAD-dependent epimerase/dehydratase family protein [Patescibacteria group bacterium]|nr:NAD-dependent epimerase/dehydratase family protein [Patescibacteria group bacterium]
MKKIILTGASSFTGTKFIELYGSKYEITPVSRSNTTNPFDLNDREQLKALFAAIRPDAVVHLAATIGRDAHNANVLTVDVATTKSLIDLAKEQNIPFVYTSSEVVYDGRPDGMFEETDEYHPRSDYGKSKVISEEYLKASDLPYLITRGHRYIGYPSKGFDRPKQFPDALKDLTTGNEIHTDSKRKVTLILIDNICDIIDHYIEHDSDKQIILNMGMEKVTTYYNLWLDIARAASIDTELIHSDGDEPGWLMDSTLSTQKLRDLGYPQRSYEEVINTIVRGIKDNNT